MNTIERTRAILNALEGIGTHLNDYAEDAWLAADLEDNEDIMAVAEQQVELRDAINAFASLSSRIEGLIRDHAREELEAHEETSEARATAERLHADLDREVVYTLSESFTHKRPYAVRFQGESPVETRTWKAMYRWFLAQMHAREPARFAELVNSNFAKGKRDSVRIDRTTDRLRSPATAGGLFFETNLSANSTRDQMASILEFCGYPADSLEIFLDRDLNAGE